MTFVGPMLPGFTEGLDHPAVTQIDDADRVLTGLEHRAADRRRNLPDDTSIGPKRIDPDLADAWCPHVVLFGTQLDPDQEQRLAGIVTALPRVAIAAVTTSQAITTWRYQLDEDGTATPSTVRLGPHTATGHRRSVSTAARAHHHQRHRRHHPSTLVGPRRRLRQRDQGRHRHRHLPATGPPAGHDARRWTGRGRSPKRPPMATVRPTAPATRRPPPAQRQPSRPPGAARTHPARAHDRRQPVPKRPRPTAGTNDKIRAPTTNGDDVEGWRP